MSEKFGRSARLRIVTPESGVITIHTVDGRCSIESPGLSVTFGRGFRMSWDVVKTLHGAANTARISVFGLSESTYKQVVGAVSRPRPWTEAERKALATTGLQYAPDPTVLYPGLGIAYVTLEVGYQQQVGQIFEGSSERIEFMAVRPETILQIDASDQGAGIREGAIRQAWGPGTKLVDVVAALVAAMGGHVSATQRALLATLGATVGHVDYPYGFTADGQAHAILTETLRVLDVKWTFQDGEFTLLGADGLLPLPPILLSETTGLVGQPRSLEGGGVRVFALQDAELRPGRAVLLVSRQVSGTYRVEHSRFSGDTHEGAATVECELGEPLAGDAIDQMLAGLG